MAKVTKEMLIGDVMRMDKDVALIFMHAGLHCLGCPASQMESIAEAGEVHGIDADALVAEINEFFAKKENQE